MNPGTRLVPSLMKATILPSAERLGRPLRLLAVAPLVERLASVVVVMADGAVTVTWRCASWLRCTPPGPSLLARSGTARRCPRAEAPASSMQCAAVVVRRRARAPWSPRGVQPASHLHGERRRAAEGHADLRRGTGRIDVRVHRLLQASSAATSAMHRQHGRRTHHEPRAVVDDHAVDGAAVGQRQRRRRVVLGVAGRRSASRCAATGSAGRMPPASR